MWASCHAQRIANQRGWMRSERERHGLKPVYCPVQTKHTHAQARDSDVRPAAREARAAQQTATGAAVANRRHDRASARIRTVEHRAHRKLSVQRQSQLDPVRQNSSQQRNCQANRYTRNWYCPGQYAVGSGDRIPPPRDTLSCTKSRQPRNEGHISLFRLFIVHNMQSSPITRLQGTEMRHARSTHPKAQGRARVGQQSTRTHKPRTRTCGWSI